MYLWTGKKRGQAKKRGKSNRHRAKNKAKNRRRVQGMQGRKVGRRLKKGQTS